MKSLCQTITGAPTTGLAAESPHATITLIHGHCVLVDQEDYARVSRIKWWPSRKNLDVIYARGRVGDREAPMHRFILGEIPAGMQIDHINRNGLDNRRSNLRLCTPRQNRGNERVRMVSNKPSGFKGVTWDKHRHQWMAKITVNYKTVNLGRYNSEIDAARAYNKAAVKSWGEFSRINEIPAA